MMRIRQFGRVRCLRWAVLLPFLPCLLFVLAGCSASSTAGNSPSLINTASETPNPARRGAANSAPGAGEENSPPGSVPDIRQKDTRDPVLTAADYPDKCTLYWKFNWIRHELLKGTIPYDREMLTQLRYQLELTGRDANYALIDKILKSLDLSRTYFDDARTLRISGIDAASLPWKNGPEIVRQSLKPAVSPDAPIDRKPGYSDESDEENDSVMHPASAPPAIVESPVSTVSPHDTNLILDYVRRHRASPQQMLQRELSAALVDIIALRAGLQLQDRDATPDTDESTVPDKIGEKDVPGAHHLPYNLGSTNDLGSTKTITTPQN